MECSVIGIELGIERLTQPFDGIRSGSPGAVLGYSELKFVVGGPELTLFFLFSLWHFAALRGELDSRAVDYLLRFPPKSRSPKKLGSN